MAISLNDIYTEALSYIKNNVVGRISDPVALVRHKINPNEEFTFDIIVSNGSMTSISPDGDSTTETEVLVGVPIKNVYLELMVTDPNVAELIVPSAPIVASIAIGGQVLVPGTAVKKMFIHDPAKNYLQCGEHEIKQLKGKIKDIDIRADIVAAIAVFIYAEVDLFPHTVSNPNQTSFKVYYT